MANREKDKLLISCKVGCTPKTSNPLVDVGVFTQEEVNKLHITIRHTEMQVKSKRAAFVFHESKVSYLMRKGVIPFLSGRSKGTVGHLSASSRTKLLSPPRAAKERSYMLFAPQCRETLALSSLKSYLGGRGFVQVCCSIQERRPVL